MPYALYETGFIVAAGNFPIGGSSVFVASDNPDLLYFYLKPQVVNGIQSALNTALSTVINGADTFAVNGELYQILINQISVANITSSTPVTLTRFDGSTVSYSLTDANTLLSNISTYLTSVYTNYNSLEAALTAAVTYTELNAIDVNSGWPSNVL